MNTATMKLPLALSAALLLFAASAHAEKANPERNVYFGDTHAHSELSGDAYGFGNRLPPETAYRLARGEEVDHIGGYKIKLKAPLDFFMMTDHSELIGMASLAKDKSSAFYKTKMAEWFRAGTKEDGSKILFAMQNATTTGVPPKGYNSAALKTVWERIQANAETPSTTPASSPVLAELGDRFALSVDYAGKTAREVDQTFGPAFGEQLLEAPVGEWFGPVESAYGLHLVRVLGRSEPRLPEFDELRDRLSTDYSFETRRAANALALERLTERYQIVFEESGKSPPVGLVSRSGE